jgi:hypothetical protein
MNSLTIKIQEYISHLPEDEKISFNRELAHALHNPSWCAANKINPANSNRDRAIVQRFRELYPRRYYNFTTNSK